ncbi:hypothetical protein VTN02DRAFT_6283 [Thermoascus thermophilus]
MAEVQRREAALRQREIQHCRQIRDVAPPEERLQEHNRPLGRPASIDRPAPMVQEMHSAQVEKEPGRFRLNRAPERTVVNRRTHLATATDRRRHMEDAHHDDDDNGPREYDKIPRRNTTYTRPRVDVDHPRDFEVPRRNTDTYIRPRVDVDDSNRTSRRRQLGIPFSARNSLPTRELHRPHPYRARDVFSTT